MHPLFEKRFLQFLVYFNEHQDYFECHEVLEDYWKDIAPRNKQHPLTMYVLLSTGMYHWRRGNTRGAKKSFHACIQRYEETKSDSSYYEWIDIQSAVNFLQNCLQKDEFPPFSPFSLRVDGPLITHLQLIKPTLPKIHTDEFLLHKHTLRDRSEIINQRLTNKKKRQ